MIIAVKAHEWQQAEWNAKPLHEGIDVVWINNQVPAADAYFDLTYEEYGPAFAQVTEQPVFINAVTDTLASMPANVSRINAWNGFLKRETVEVVSNNASAKAILEKMGWKFTIVPDVPGMIAARTIAMIINEAYFALGDAVSSKQDIDTAMKLGTNYPFGPFEWSEKIGLHRIFRLLNKLRAEDERYQPAPALEQELKAIA